MLRICFFVSLLLVQGLCFSLPGISLESYKNGEQIQVYANELDSVETQLKFEYYFLKFCKPEKVTTVSESLGSILLGESTVSTTFNISMDVNRTCVHQCKVELNKGDTDNFIWMIQRDYAVDLMIDNLPALYHTGNDNPTQIGFPLGKRISEKEYRLYNHLTLEIDFFTQATGQKRVVEFKVIPRSIEAVNVTKDELDSGSLKGYCEANPGAAPPAKSAGITLSPGQPATVFFSYDVVFRESASKEYASRWDNYAFFKNDKVRWVSILNAFLVNLFLTALIACILKKTVGNDIRMYNELRTSEDIQEERGWKQLSRDVFRPPRHALLLSVLIGTGVQVAAMCFLTILCACLGFMEQSYRGGLQTMMLLFYNFMGIFAGYYSARIYKMFNGPHWIKCTFTTALFYPGIIFLIFYAVNFVTTFEQSANAFHPTTILILFGLIFGISIPLVLLGSIIGFKKQAIQNPSKFNPIPRFIKPQPWYLNKNMLSLLGGFLPFMSIYMELHFIMTSVWHHSFYYLFVFLMGVLIILIMTSAEISIVITYLQLCNGNHKVWWNSFFNTGSIAIYLFAYAIFYYHHDLEAMTRFSSTFLYFGYMFAMSFTLCIFCGMVGFLASYWFIRQIYSSIRID